MLRPWVLSELIEAAVRTGNDALARDALERLEESTRWGSYTQVLWMGVKERAAYPPG
jgi:hypothetical protein